MKMLILTALAWKTMMLILVTLTYLPYFRYLEPYPLSPRILSVLETKPNHPEETPKIPEDFPKRPQAPQ